MAGDVVDSKQRRVLIGVAVVIAIVAAILVTVVLTRDDDPEATTTTTSSSVALEPGTSSSTSSTGPTTTTTLNPAIVDLVMYPDVASGKRFDDPTVLVAAFATDYLGFSTDVQVLGPSVSSDGGTALTRFGAPGAPTSTASLRKLSDGTWAITDVTSEPIEVTGPVPGTKVTSPLTLTGSAVAFEGHVDVALYVDGENTPIATGFVTGRGDGIPGEFSKPLAFTVPDGATRGLLVFSSANGDDGTSSAATAVRVLF